LFQTLSRDRRQAAATNEEAVRYAHGQSAAAGAQDYSVEADPATAVATEEDSTPEGLPQPVGHPSSTPHVAAVEAAGTSFTTAWDATETTGQGTSGNPDPAGYHGPSSTVRTAVGDYRRRRRQRHRGDPADGTGVSRNTGGGHAGRTRDPDG